MWLAKRNMAVWTSKLEYKKKGGGFCLSHNSLIPVSNKMNPYCLLKELKRKKKKMLSLLAVHKLNIMS